MRRSLRSCRNPADVVLSRRPVQRAGAPIGSVRLRRDVQPLFTGPRRANLERRRVQVEQWIAEESSPIHEVELIQQRLDIDAQLAQIDQASRLPELEEAFVKVAAA